MHSDWGYALEKLENHLDSFGLGSRTKRVFGLDFGFFRIRLMTDSIGFIRFAAGFIRIEI